MDSLAVARIGFRTVPGLSSLRITIDDIDLPELIPACADKSTVFTRVWGEHWARLSTAAFQGVGAGDPRLEADQIKLAVCPHCGDVECGAVVARLRLTDTQVTWHDFSQTWGRDLNAHYREDDPQDFSAHFDRELVFARIQYEAALEAALAELTNLPGPPGDESLWRRVFKRPRPR